jgi:hypothetical protein
LFPRSEAVIVSRGLRQLLLHFVMIKPTHYDDDGYPIQWFRSAIPSNTLAWMNARRRTHATGTCLDPMSKNPPAYL